MRATAMFYEPVHAGVNDCIQNNSNAETRISKRTKKKNTYRCGWHYNVASIVITLYLQRDTEKPERKVLKQKLRVEYSGRIIFSERCVRNLQHVRKGTNARNTWFRSLGIQSFCRGLHYVRTFALGTSIAIHLKMSSTTRVGRRSFCNAVANTKLKNRFSRSKDERSGTVGKENFHDPRNRVGALYCLPRSEPASCRSVERNPDPAVIVSLRSRTKCVWARRSIFIYGVRDTFATLLRTYCSRRFRVQSLYTTRLRRRMLTKTHSSDPDTRTVPTDYCL